MIEGNLGKALYEAVDEGFTLLGKSAKMIIYTYLERNHSIKPGNLLNEVEVFTGTLDLLLGEGGKSLTTKVIAKRFYNKLGLDFEEKEGWGLLEYVDDAKQKLSRINKQIQKASPLIDLTNTSKGF